MKKYLDENQPLPLMMYFAFDTELGNFCHLPIILLQLLLTVF